MTRKSGSTAKVVAEYPDVKLKLADGSEYAYSGHVSAVSGVINQTTGSVSMRADFTNPQHLLKSGGSGTILVPVVNHDAIVIPQDAVSQVQDKYFVYILQSNNKVKYSEITVSETNDGQNYVVTTGLKVGDRIAVAGVSALSDGMEIKPITEDQYAAKLKKAEQLGSVQNDKDKLMKAFGK
jgi:membrane fusion protein (multidrug efflux system)